ncbi:MAG: prepilin-type N-terminal cleavage/methylation domain-containing protein [Patescibacteria group bacterium]|jgi:Tfp pilus assembly protein FimT|nr:prepilin-type N-terminal cleavage/methylation domain-containing protein [Patescibacteria group bacterium]MDD5173007.1 prepilin-type N-terminal cleavage/methylation domain-containing protein [Patescibacteria group bacterium]
MLNYFVKLKVSKHSNNQCFTLVELMVVIAITVLVGGAIFANMRSGGRSMDLNSASEKMAGIIKQAQMMALSGKQIDSSRPEGGYGVYFDNSTVPNSYKLFANTSQPNDYEYDIDDTEIQTITLSEEVRIVDPSQTSIIFKPPYGPIYISSGEGGIPLTGADRVLILLQHLDANFYNYVRVNSQGEIDVRKTE